MKNIQSLSTAELRKARLGADENMTLLINGELKQRMEEHVQMARKGGIDSTTTRAILRDAAL